MTYRMKCLDHSSICHARAMLALQGSAQKSRACIRYRRTNGHPFCGASMRLQSNGQVHRPIYVQQIRPMTFTDYMQSRQLLPFVKESTRLVQKSKVGLVCFGPHERDGGDLCNNFHEHKHSPCIPRQYAQLTSKLLQKWHKLYVQPLSLVIISKRLSGCRLSQIYCGYSFMYSTVLSHSVGIV